MILSFRIGSIPVRIHPSFFLMALILGASPGAGGLNPVQLGLWAAVVFVGVLAHELGHAVVGMAFGLMPAIDLHGMGGATSWPLGKRVSNAKSVLISLAGPFTGLALGGLIYAAIRLHPPEPGLLATAASLALEVNVLWGVFNLLPILPMDGGNVMRSVLNGLTNGEGERPARIVSIVLAVLLGAAAFYVQNAFMGIIALLFAYQSFAALRPARA